MACILNHQFIHIMFSLPTWQECTYTTFTGSICIQMCETCKNIFPYLTDQILHTDMSQIREQERMAGGACISRFYSYVSNPFAITATYVYLRRLFTSHISHRYIRHTRAHARKQTNEYSFQTNLVEKHTTGTSNKIVCVCWKCWCSPMHLKFAEETFHR